MGARRGWATAVVVALVLVFAGGGGAYLWKEWKTDTDESEGNGDPIADASADARAGRGKKKPGKKGGQRGKPRGGGGRVATGGRGGAGAGAGAGGGSGAGVGGNGSSSDDDGEGDDPNAGTIPFRPPFTGRGPAGPTYEAAIASNKQEIAIGTQSGPDLTDAQLSRPMRDGAFVGECGAPDSMKVTVKVAIKTGRAAGVSVSTAPSDPDVAGCIDRYVRTFSWPSNPKMDSFTTTY